MRDETTLLQRDGFRLTLDDSDTWRLYDDRFSWLGDDEPPQPVFETDAFRPSAMYAQDSDHSVASVLSFLALEPGDTDVEYFDDYTPRQRAWRDLRAEDLWSIVAEIDDCLTPGPGQSSRSEALLLELFDVDVLRVYDCMTGQIREHRFSSVARDEDGRITAEGWQDLRGQLEEDNWQYRSAAFLDISDANI